MKRHLANIAFMSGALSIALASYLVSARVAAERTAVEGLRGAIAADMEDIQGLEAELRIRARLPQLEQWNREVLALQAPRAGQFARDALHLASLVAPPVAAATMATTAATAPSAAPAPTDAGPAPEAAPAVVAASTPRSAPDIAALPGTGPRSPTLVAAAILPAAAQPPVRQLAAPASDLDLGSAIAAELERLPAPPDPLGQ